MGSPDPSSLPPPVPAAAARAPSPTALGKRKAVSSTMGFGRLAMDAAEEQEIKRQRRRVEGLVNPVDARTGLFTPDPGDSMKVLKDEWSPTISGRMALCYGRIPLHSTRLEGANRCKRCDRLESKLATTGVIKPRPDFGCTFWLNKGGSILLSNCAECYIMGKTCQFEFADNMKTVTKMATVELALKRQNRQQLSAVELAEVLMREQADRSPTMAGSGGHQAYGRKREALPRDGASDASTIKEVEKMQGGDDSPRAGSKGREESRGEEDYIGGPSTPTITGLRSATTHDRESNGKHSEVESWPSEQMQGGEDSPTAGSKGRDESWGEEDGIGGPSTPTFNGLRPATTRDREAHGEHSKVEAWQFAARERPHASTSDERSAPRRSSADLGTHGIVAEDESEGTKDSASEDSAPGIAGVFEGARVEIPVDFEQGSLNACGIRDAGDQADDHFSTGPAVNGLLALRGGPSRQSARKAAAVGPSTSSRSSGSNGGSPLPSGRALPFSHRDLAPSPSRTADTATSQAEQDMSPSSRSSSRHPSENFALSTPGQKAAWDELDKHLRGGDQPFERYGVTIKGFKAVISGSQTKLNALHDMLTPLRWNMPAEGTAEDIKALTDNLRRETDNWVRRLWSSGQEKDMARSEAIADMLGWLMELEYRVGILLKS